MSSVAWHPDWLVPQWPVPSAVRALCTSRVGGVSLAPYDSLNLGRPSADDWTAVERNRQLLQQAIGLAPVFLSQVHGTATLELDAPPQPGAPASEADASVSAVPGVVCTVRVADCLPVLLSDAQGRVVGAAHAGWRGLAHGVLERQVQALLRVLARLDGAASAPGSLVAWLGPCIGPQAFEVGPDVRQAFVGRDQRTSACFVDHHEGKWLADLPALARLRLRAAGVTEIHGNDGSHPWCTFGNPSRFFSHRRDSRVLGGSGRMAACIWLDPGH